MPLSDPAIRNAKSAEKPRKLFDEKGLFLLVAPNGGKWWRLKYRFDGKEKLLSLGVYPDVGLKDARDRRDEARKQLAAGIDPGEQRKAIRASTSGADSFETIAREWWERYHAGWTQAHADRVLAGLSKDVFPYIGTQPINAITAPTMLSVIQRIEERGAVETGHRLRQTSDVIFAYAIATGRCDNNPAAGIKKALQTITGRRHFARLKEPSDIGDLLRSIDGYVGTHIHRSHAPRGNASWDALRPESDHNPPSHQTGECLLHEIGNAERPCLHSSSLSDSAPQRLSHVERGNEMNRSVFVLEHFRHGASLGAAGSAGSQRARRWPPERVREE